MPNNVELKIDGELYTGWQSVSVVRSIEALAGAFDLRLTSKDPFPIPRGGAVELRLHGNVVINGFSDEISPSISASENSLNTSGRDKTGDLVDCSTLIDSQELINVTLRDIITQVIEPFGIPLEYKITENPLFPKYTVQQETAFDAIERACRLSGVMATSTPSGALLIQEYGANRAPTSLILGQNVISAAPNFDESEKYSVYYVYGQQSGNDNISPQAATQSQGVAYDATVKRYRPLIIIAEGSVDNTAAQKRAEWEAAVRSARAVTCDVVVKGWEAVPGKLWHENDIVKASLSEVGIDSDMLIKEVSFTLDDGGGEETSLVLVKPTSYKVSPTIKSEGLGL